jgi:hypothetical protein
LYGHILFFMRYRQPNPAVGQGVMLRHASLLNECQS